MYKINDIIKLVREVWGDHVNKKCCSMLKTRGKRKSRSTFVEVDSKFGIDFQRYPIIKKAFNSIHEEEEEE